MTRLTPALPLLAALCLGPHAGRAETAADQAFARLDTNGNGAISREEFLALRRQMFAALDADGDGLLTRQEIEAARAAGSGGAQPRRSNQIWQQDANGDGRLTLTEYTARTRGFDFADSDGNGSLSQTEFARIARFMAPAQ